MLRPFSEEEQNKVNQDILSSISPRTYRSGTYHFIPPTNQYDLCLVNQIPNIDTPLTIFNSSANSNPIDIYVHTILSNDNNPSGEVDSPFRRASSNSRQRSNPQRSPNENILLNPLNIFRNQSSRIVEPAPPISNPFRSVNSTSNQNNQSSNQRSILEEQPQITNPFMMHTSNSPFTHSNNQTNSTTGQVPSSNPFLQGFLNSSQNQSNTQSNITHSGNPFLQSFSSSQTNPFLPNSTVQPKPQNPGQKKEENQNENINVLPNQNGNINQIENNNPDILTNIIDFTQNITPLSNQISNPFNDIIHVYNNDSQNQGANQGATISSNTQNSENNGTANINQNNTQQNTSNQDKKD